MEVSLSEPTVMRASAARDEPAEPTAAASVVPSAAPLSPPEWRSDPPMLLEPAAAGVGFARVYRKVTFGTGEGDQPKPEYPPEADEAGQQGTVAVRYVVGIDGAVKSAEIAQASPWPLLNQAALRAIRQAWHYPPGLVRYLEVRIVFQHTATQG